MQAAILESIHIDCADIFTTIPCVVAVVMRFVAGGGCPKTQS